MTLDRTTLVPLTTAERRELLLFARRNIQTALQGDAPPELQAVTPALTQPGAAFVSLHRDQKLRGCIGTLASERPLYRTVGRLAVSAAFDDPRFPPLTHSELPGLEIEISRLSLLVPASPDEIHPGRHGVSITHGDHRSVFLPQVALEHHWDRDTLLRELCRKALLEPDAWKHPATQLLLFEAEVFAEDSSWVPGP